jgi:outer membrane protein insertion porin family
MRWCAIPLLAVTLASLTLAQQKQRATPSPVPQATATQTPTVFPLETLRVEGNRRITTEKIVAVAGLKTGATVVKQDFDDARTRLLATGAFESVGYEFKPSAANTGYDGVLQVVEVDQLFPYRFEDLPVSEETLRAELRKQEFLLGDQIPATTEVLDRYVKVIEQGAGSSVKVAGKLNSEIPGQLTIVFRPSTPRANIAEVRFSGNSVLPSVMLVNSLSAVAVGVPYSDVTIRLLVEASIRPLYDARGRIRVAFPRIIVEKAGNVDGVVVTVEVNEGPSYSFGKVSFAGVAETDAAELQKAANLQSKDIANFDDINAGLDRVYRRFKAKGYLRVAGKVDRDINDAEHTVDLTVTIELGPQFTMGKLEIAGLDIHSEPAIRKVWAIQPGAPFQPEYPDAFLNGLREQGVFDNLGKTTSETNIDEKAHTVDVTLHFSGSGGTRDGKSDRK